MVKAALIGLLTAVVAISSGNHLAIAQSAGTVASTSTTKATSTTAVTPKTATKATGTSAKTTGTTAKTTAAKTTGTTAKATGTSAAKTTGTTAKTTGTATKATGSTSTTSKSTGATTTSKTGTTVTTATKAKTTPSAATAKTLTKSKSTGTTGTAKASATTTSTANSTTTAAKKTLTKSSSTNTRVVIKHQPTNGLPNWIGPIVNAPTGKACYRQTHIAKTCPPGFHVNKTVGLCWAECPLDYPVRCGMECIPQNKDCGVEVVTKISAVANAALSTASVGVFGHITKTVKGLDVAVRCGKQLYDIVQKILEHIADIEEKQPKTTKEQLVTLLMKSDFAVIDLPLAVTTCIGSSIANAFSTASEIVTPVKNIINAVIEKRAAALEPKTFVELSTTAGVKQVGKMPATEVSKLDKVITCGGELKSIVDKVIAKVNEIKEKAPASPVDAIRLSLTTSELFLVDIPQATNDCIPKSTKDFYAVRDQVRKSFQTIIDKVIDSSSDTATKTEKPLKKRDYALKVASFGLDAIAFFDPTGIAAMAREFIQKICGPTQFIGEVDDGPLEKALGLHTIGKAFETSNGAYKKKGDGKVKLTFISNDNENVEVNIFSAGQLIDTVKLENGVVKKWEKSMKEMQDKTLYLDRWRPGFLRIPGTGGGSLVMWIPHSSQGGHVDLTVSVNVS